MKPSDSSLGMDRPFKGVPSIHCYVPIGPIEEARQRLGRMIDRGEALGVVMGPPGTGKSLLCQRIAAAYRTSHWVVLLGDIRVTSRLGLIQQVLYHLHQPHQPAEEGALYLMLIEWLSQSPDGSRPLLLIIDEAQMLSAELLDEVRMLTNLARNGRPLVQTVLVGSPKLEEPLADPQQESLAQRIAARCYLHPMNQAETAKYIRVQLASSAMSIDEDAIATIQHATMGVPRLINQLMSQAVEFATRDRAERISADGIQRAWADLQQLPSPLLEPKLRECATSRVEFGELREPSDEGRSAVASSRVAERSDNEARMHDTRFDEDYLADDGAPAFEDRIGGDDAALPLTPASAALFGDGFDDERAVEVGSASPPRFYRDPVASMPPIEREVSHHDDLHAHDRVGDSTDVSPSMAVFWRDDEPSPMATDDRDLLVIEDDIEVLIDPPSRGVVGSGSLRKPTESADRSFRNLFTRLRSGE